MDEKKNIMKKAIKRAQSGESKNFIFEELSNSINKSQLATQFANVPDSSLLEKYGYLNLIFIISLVFMTMIKLFNSYFIFRSTSLGILLSVFIASITILINFIFILFAIRKFGSIYLPASILIFVSILQSTDWIEQFATYTLFGKILVIVNLLISVLAAISGLLVNRKIFPYLKLFKPNVDENGIRVFTTEKE